MMISIIAKNSAPIRTIIPEALQKVKISHKTAYTGLRLVITITLPSTNRKAKK